MYLGRVLKNPRIIRFNYSIDNRLEHIFRLHYLHHPGMSDRFGQNLFVLKFTAQLTLWGHVERGQFT